MAEQRITLDRGDYFELSALTDRAQKIEIEAQHAIARLRDRGNIILTRLGKEHGFDPVNTFRLEDDGCVLIISSNGEQP
jgi:hypothetical protein